MSLRWPIEAVLRGQPRPFTRPGTSSTLGARTPVSQARVTGEGLEGDAVGDARVHGGRDKAIHHYPAEHYDAWRAELGPLAGLAVGGFGENLSTRGLDEGGVCLGDVFELGTTVLELSQGRQPCWKLGDAHRVAGLAMRVQRTGRTGWYYRVRRPGEFAVGDALHLVSRPWPEWTVARINALLFEPVLDEPTLRAALALPLVASWRATFEQRLLTGRSESWGRRLNGP